MRILIAIIGGVVGLLAISVIVFFQYTKSHSPAELVKYDDSITIKYFKPFKKGREIFGGLVPYNEVWRTGANWATTIHLTKNILFKGKEVPAGIYTIWTVPGKESWQVILNEEAGQWGIGFLDGKPNHDPKRDVVKVETPVMHSEKSVEQFTITLEGRDDELEMVMIWDKTLISVPIMVQK
ncbi:MAG: DUF2911 domain-containing protein [Cyclobacteriaceae bacterium]|nr:DUF2911 domain-containing protein [Cyclobacteriaceae bacterium]